MLDAPEQACWLTEVEGRRYWKWIDTGAGSFRLEALRRESACPFRHGLYQLMRSRVLANALIADGGCSWARIGVYIHPGNERARRLPDAVAGSSDVLEAFQWLTAPAGVVVLEPAAIVEAVESEAPRHGPWAAWVRQKYLLG